jgi:nucleotide-binding universal stress UspA family protein
MSRRTLVIGVDGGAPAGDAIALGAVLAPALDADPTLVYAHPYGALEDVVGSGEYATLVRELADDAARQVQAHFGLANAARLRVLPNPSPAAALQAVARQERAAGVVIGSSHRGAIGRMLPGAVRHVADQAGDADELTVELREGDPVSELVTASRDSGLLVVGSRGYGPLGAVLLGSVSTRVVEHAACPVMVVPRTAPTPQPPPADAADLWANRRARHPL